MSNPNVEKLRNGATRLREDYTASEIASMLQYSRRTITRWTAKPREEYLAQSKERREKVHELHSEGKTPKEISDVTGYALSSVYAILKKVA